MARRWYANFGFAGGLYAVRRSPRPAEHQAPTPHRSSSETCSGHRQHTVAEKVSHHTVPPRATLRGHGRLDVPRVRRPGHQTAQVPRVPPEGPVTDQGPR